MKFIKLLFALSVISMYVVANVPTCEIKIVANTNVGLSEISRDELNRIFLMTKTSLPGVPHVEPVLENAGMARDLFLKLYMGRTHEALMTYYRGLLFAGKGSIPKSFNSDLEVINYVAKTKGAIGYVNVATDTAAIKNLRVK
jgi:hypothetical protein